MFKIKSAARLAIIMALIIASNLCLALMIGLVPDLNQQAIRERVRFSEILALNAASLAENNRLADLQKVVEQLASRNPELLSLGIRKADQTYRFQTGKHQRIWEPGLKSPEQIAVEIRSSGRTWGIIELRFKPLRGTFLTALWHYPLGMILFVSCGSCLLAWLALARTFRYLDPTKVVPNRVRSALDSLTEGLVLIDHDLRIVHANQVFGRMVGRPPEELLGTPLDSFEWQFEPGQSAPWHASVKTRQPIVGQVAELRQLQEVWKYNINTNPIAGPKSECRGCLVSFDDVTLLERKKNDLAALVVSLQRSRDEIQQQNVKLKFLASRDPLTKCYNRRTFWELFDETWSNGDRNLTSVIMVDIDHFKAINDNHGHSKGDEVLRETGAMLLHLVGDEGIVCRYGGEEFAILLNALDLEGASRVARTIHKAFQRCRIGGLDVTASLGLSHRCFRAMDAQHLLDQADQCLYAAKRNGRNQVVPFDQLDKLERRQSPRAVIPAESPKHVSYASAQALFTALAYRDRDAAYFAQRVADLCVLIARKRMDLRTLYWLEICGLLHSIGKLGGADLELPPGSESADPLSTLTNEVLRNTFGAEELVWITSGRSAARFDDPVSAELATRLDLCHSILQVSVRMVGLGMQGRRIAPSEIQAGLRPIPSDSDATLVQEILNLLARQSQLLSTRCRDASVECAIKLSPLVDDICTSIANRDMTQLKLTVTQVGKIASETGNRTIKTIVESLEKVLERHDPELEQVSQLADQILELCRSTRQSLVSQVEASLGTVSPT